MLRVPASDDLQVKKTDEKNVLKAAGNEYNYIQLFYGEMIALQVRYH